MHFKEHFQVSDVTIGSRKHIYRYFDNFRNIVQAIITPAPTIIRPTVKLTKRIKKIAKIPRDASESPRVSILMYCHRESIMVILPCSCPINNGPHNFGCNNIKFG